MILTFASCELNLLLQWIVLTQRMQKVCYLCNVQILSEVLMTAPVSVSRDSDLPLSAVPAKATPQRELHSMARKTCTNELYLSLL